MEYVIVGMLGVLIILQVGNLFKKKNDTETIERLGKLELGMVKEIGEQMILEMILINWMKKLNANLWKLIIKLRKD